MQCPPRGWFTAFFASLRSEYLGEQMEYLGVVVLHAKETVSASFPMGTRCEHGRRDGAPRRPLLRMHDPDAGTDGGAAAARALGRGARRAGAAEARRGRARDRHRGAEYV